MTPVKESVWLNFLFQLRLWFKLSRFLFFITIGFKRGSEKVRLFVIFSFWVPQLFRLGGSSGFNWGAIFVWAHFLGVLGGDFFTPFPFYASSFGARQICGMGNILGGPL